MIEKRKIKKIDIDRQANVEIVDFIAIDKPVNIFVNGDHFVTLIASPKNIRELALGHLLGEGVIASLDDIERIAVKGVKVTVRATNEIQLRKSTSLKVIPTGCGTSEDFLLFPSSVATKTKSMAVFRAVDISRAFKLLQLSAKVFRKSGGTHVAALFTRGGMLQFCMEDVGRHNAVDKVIGKGMLEKVNFAKTFLISTGRLSADIVVKCARAKIPLVASKAAPLESGVLAGEMTGLTVVGFLRGARLNVYTGFQRVKI